MKREFRHGEDVGGNSIDLRPLDHYNNKTTPHYPFCQRGEHAQQAISKTAVGSIPFTLADQLRRAARRLARPAGLPPAAAGNQMS